MVWVLVQIRPVFQIVTMSDNDSVCHLCCNHLRCCTCDSWLIHVSTITPIIDVPKPGSPNLSLVPSIMRFAYRKIDVVNWTTGLRVHLDRIKEGGIIEAFLLNENKINQIRLHLPRLHLFTSHTSRLSTYQIAWRIWLLHICLKSNV